MSGTCIRKSNLKKESRDMGLMQGLNNITSGRVYSPIFTSHIVLCISPVGAISAYLINIKNHWFLFFWLIVLTHHIFLVMLEYDVFYQEMLVQLKTLKLFFNFNSFSNEVVMISQAYLWISLMTAIVYGRSSLFSHLTSVLGPTTASSSAWIFFWTCNQLKFTRLN